ncbi:MAG: hypothetical protein NC413_09190 [Muribaculum sp.]|nr:hypothetical protein [Muribaculum sp.]
MIFFIIVFGILLILQAVRRSGKAWGCKMASRVQVVVMLLASLFFMAIADIRFLLCIGVLTGVSYFCAVFWERYHKRVFIAGGYCSLLGC